MILHLLILCTAIIEHLEKMFYLVHTFIADTAHTNLMVMHIL